MQLRGTIRGPVPRSRFQSSCSPWAECNPGPTGSLRPSSGFNPHSALGLNATADQCSQVVPTAGFNPHASLGLNATGCTARATCGARRFNPHASLGLNATVRHPDIPNRARTFQSSFIPWAECNPTAKRRTSARYRFQSSFIPWAECNQSPRPYLGTVWPSFNPHSSLGLNATNAYVIKQRGEQVSILIHPLG